MSPRALVVVAHPDDETLYFSSRLRGADVVCMTDGDFGGLGEARQRAFHDACARWGVHSSACWGHPDNPVWHLPVDAIEARLRALHASERYSAVYTHSPHGEYGHLNHMDVSIAVLRAFEGVLQPRVCADRLHVTELVALDRDDHRRKLAVLADHYRDEMDRAWPVAPLTSTEAFTHVALPEAELIYSFCTGGDAPDPSRLDAYAHLTPFLPLLARQAQPFTSTK